MQKDKDSPLYCQEQESLVAQNVSSTSSSETHIDKKVHYIGSYHEASKGEIKVDNDFILHGYRINYNTPILTLKSLFHKHNELVNIWTHLIGGALILALIIYMSLFFSSIQHIKEQITDDLNKILQSPYLGQFTKQQQYLQLRIPQQENVNSGQDFFNYDIHQLIYDIQRLENMLFTPEIYQQLLEKVSHINMLFQFNTSVLSNYSNAITSTMESIKTNILYQIDSEQFNWMEIYKYNYTWLDEKIVYKQFYPRNPTDPLRISRWPIIVFLISAIMCLFGSASFHLFYQMSSCANRYLMRVDYAGISLLVLGSTFPPFYYGFYCDPLIRNGYLLLIGTACFIVYVISIFDFIHSEKWRRVKGVMYASLGLFAGVPALHLYIREKMKEPITDYLPFEDSFPFMVLMGASYLIGLVFYIKRIPEKYYPGKFDIWFHSHQIWHIFVFLGVLFSYVAAIDNLFDRKQTPCLLR